MTCFIANPHVCRAYAKCHGWQETLAHFFIKSRRESSTRLPTSSVSTGAISSYLKDPNIDSGRESSSDTAIDNSNINIPLVRPPIFETSSSPDDPTKDKLVQQLELSPIITDRNLPRTLSSTRYSSLSNSMLSPMNISIDGRDTTPEFLRRNSEEFQVNTIDMITTPIQSSTTSREDLHSLVKTEDLASVASSNDMANLLPTMNITSIKHLCDDEKNNEQHRRLGSVLRQILGRLLEHENNLKLFGCSSNSIRFDVCVCQFFLQSKY
jgi:hypothetical protein